jgi:acetolactate synthase regulatory subunit
MNKLEEVLNILKKNGFSSLVSSVLWKSDGEYLEINLKVGTAKEHVRLLERQLRVVSEVEIKIIGISEPKTKSIDDPLQLISTVNSLMQHPNAAKLFINKESIETSPSGGGLSMCMIDVKYNNSTAKHYFESLRQGEPLVEECLNDLSAKRIDVTIWE